jgi:hypothetical protein
MPINAFLWIIKRKLTDNIIDNDDCLLHMLDEELGIKLNADDYDEETKDKVRRYVKYFYEISLT